MSGTVHASVGMLTAACGCFVCVIFLQRKKRPYLCVIFVFWDGIISLDD